MCIVEYDLALHNDIYSRIISMFACTVMFVNKVELLKVGGM